ncbi:MAG TPA: ABC transporter ATP-binding protein [Clostridiaceae bacterium]
MIEIENVTKRFGDRIAVDNLSLTVKDGEILGFLGPNGAGKTTTMNMLTGYISASEGNIRIDGIDILENPEGAKKKIGYLPELPPLYLDMTVEDYLYFVSKIKKVDKEKRTKNIESVMRVVKIYDVRHRLIKNLSKGYRQRVGLAQAIIGGPEVLVLDEPTVGLDPKQIIEIRSLIRELGKKHTIILSSHILSEVSAICDRVIIINRGKIVATGTPTELAKKFSYSNKFVLRVKGNKAQILKTLEQVPNVQTVREQGVLEEGTVDVSVEAKKDADIRENLFRALSNAGLPIFMMKTDDLSLEEVFLQVTNAEKEVPINVSGI